MIATRRTPRGFTLVELMVVVTIIGVLATITIPTLIGYLRKAKAAEVHESLQKIMWGARAYYMSDHWDQAGNFLPRAFPVGISRVPTAGPKCDRQITPTSEWDNAGWNTLHFSLIEPHYFAYNFVSNNATGTAAKYSAVANGDLDCDGIESTYELRGKINEEGEVDTAGPMVTLEAE